MMNTVHAANNSAHKIYNAQTTTLSNGMQVVVVENHRTPAITHMVWYKIGGADEIMGKSGLAHYLEHLMFKGTKKIASGDFSKKVKSWGGNDNAFTSWDYTAYFQTIPKSRIEDVMIMEADRMTGLNFDDEDALTERDVVMEERKERTDSNPAAQLSEAMRTALFVNHPYGRPIIGWDHEIERLTPQAARNFYKQYYAPQNAILVLSGDLTAQEGFDLAKRIYGPIENGQSETRPAWPKIPNVYGTQSITHSHKSVQQPVWKRIYRTPSATQDYKTSLAFSIAEDLIGKNTGRLYEEIVMKQKIASAAHFYYSGISIADTTLTIALTPLDGVSETQIQKAVDDVLQNVMNTVFSKEEIKKTVEGLQDEAIYERDSLSGPAMMIGYQLATGLTLDQIENWKSDLESITGEDIQTALKDYLSPSSKKYHAVTGFLKPEE